MTIKGHFDGTSVVLDEPVTLAVGQTVHVLVESSSRALPFADRVVLPEFRALPPVSGDTTEDVAADRDGTDDRRA